MYVCMSPQETRECVVVEDARCEGSDAGLSKTCFCKIELADLVTFPAFIDGIL